MSAAFRNLYDTARQTLSRSSTPVTVPTASEANSAISTPPPTEPATAPLEKLFTKVDPSVDGDACDHDCESCTVKYPRKFDVDEEDKLYGHISEWATHVLVATGKTDWVRDVEDEKGSVMEAFRESEVKPTNGVRIRFTCKSATLKTY